MDVQAHADVTLQPKPLALLGRDEMNLAEFPISLLTDRVPKEQKTAVYQDEIYDERTGLTLSRKLTITAGEHGLTTAVDDEVILSLIQLTKQKNNFTNRKLEFNRHELIQLLRWNGSGLSYDRVETSLDRWTSVYLKYENAWRDNRTKTWTTTGFHIIDAYQLNDSRSSDAQLGLIPSYIIWGQDIFESFQAGYLKPLDYDLCMGLKNSTAKRMYRFLDKRFYHTRELTFDLKELAHEHIGLGRNYEGPAHIKRNLQPAIEELVGIGFLEPLPDKERFQKDGRNWKVRLLQSRPANLPAPSASPAENGSEPPFLVTELTARGVTKATAEELVQQYQAEAIVEKIEVFDWLVEKHDKRVAKSPAGYLVKSIQDDYAVPKGFLSKAERQEREESQREADRKAAENRGRARLEIQCRAEERQAADAYLERLTPAERTRLETEVLAQADPETRETYEDPDVRMFRDTLMLNMLREHLAQKQNLAAVNKRPR